MLVCWQSVRNLHFANDRIASNAILLFVKWNRYDHVDIAIQFILKHKQNQKNDKNNIVGGVEIFFQLSVRKLTWPVSVVEMVASLIQDLEGS